MGWLCGWALCLCLWLAAAAAAARECPPRCVCDEGRASCRDAGLSALPDDLLHDALRTLDLSNNNITTLPRDALQSATNLRDLNLSSNRLQWVSVGALSSASLSRLWLVGCALRRLPVARLPRLHYLSVEDNELVSLEAEALSALGSLRVLRAQRNLLRAVPPALHLAPSLTTLELGDNLVSELGAGALPPLPALHTLNLKRNRITFIHERAFINTPAIRVLHLEENQLSTMPTALRTLPMLEDLWVSSNRIEEIPPEALSGSRRVARVDAAHNPLSRVDAAAFDHLPHLNTLILSDARGLSSLPSLNGSVRLHTLRADRARISAVSPALCAHAPRLRVLDLKLNELQQVPDLHLCAELHVLDLSSNSISWLGGGALRGLRRLRDLALSRNQLRRLPPDAFTDTRDLLTLDLEDNGLEYIDMEAFLPIADLQELNVGSNQLSSLPAGGLQRLRALRAHNNPRLTRFHPPHIFPRIQTLVLSYAYHCCEFMSLMEEGAAGEAVDEEEEEEESGEREGGLSDLVLVPAHHVDLATWANVSDLYAHYLNLSGEMGSRLHTSLSPAAGTTGAARGAGGAGRAGGAGGAGRRRRVACAPTPGPFLPCVDLFEWWTLRCGVWAVFLLALLGNGTVVFVLVFSRSRLDVPRFLVANLAAADFCMGLYLGFLAVVDAGTLGEFRAHAVAWQLSGGCRLAGFLGVLSSELSVFTLAVITLERNYAITHAMHLNKRLSLRHAAAVMGAGWFFAVLAATLPLFGVSDYRKFAVCLPFETESPADLGYVTLLLSINGLAFLVLLGCYLKMYCAIRGSQAWNSNDSRIAKRMALLVFTDFLCWSPIAFFALTAAFGAELVSLEEAKVFTVFVLPLNSCCNPFLYAILTKQFKKDCALVCKAIEESRVTRGIGRCRHSSNFSNRQTPANTSSLVDRSSRGHAGHAPQCACRRLLAEAPAPPPAPHAERLLRWLRACSPAPAPPRAPPPAPPKRTGSVSSSVEFSSSRSDSWRAYQTGANRVPPPPRRAASWLVARKTSQDSNLSSSRNDSSGSNATASTGTWRTSRSAGSAPAAAGVARPRLTRQPAVCDEAPLSPPAAAAAARHLTTIPSAAEDT